LKGEGDLHSGIKENMSSGSSGTKSMTSLSSSGEDVLAPLSGDVLDVGSDARRGNRGAITSSRDT